MAVFVVGVCLPILVACIIINMPLVQSNHGRHPHPDYSDLEKSPPRHREDNSEYYPDSYGQAERRGQVFDHLLEYDDFVCQCRRKRHNKHVAAGNTASDEDKKQFHEPHKITKQRFDELYDDQNKMLFEMEVKDARKISFCDYTVISIPDPRGSPKNLEQVICKQIGCRRNDVHNYCCVQTYKNIKLSYGNGKTESMKLFVGCASVFRNRKTPEELQLPDIDA